MRFREFLESQLPPKMAPFSIEALRAEVRNLFRKKVGRDPISDDELRTWSGEELKSYRTMQGEPQLKSNNDGGPPINGVSNARYYQ